MPRGERLKAPTPRAGARKLEPSRSVPDIDRFQLENRDPHGYAAKASKQAMQRVMQVTPSASARSLTASASAPQGSAVFSRADRGTIKQQPFPSPRLAYAQSPVAKEAAHAMRRPPSPALSLTSTRSASTRSGATPPHGPHARCTSAPDPNTHPNAYDEHNPWNNPAPSRAFILATGFANQRGNAVMLLHANSRRRFQRASRRHASG